MLELYLFISALVGIVIIISHRAFKVRSEEKRAFKEEVAAKVEENRKVVQEEESGSFKEDYLKASGSKRHDIGRFKDELRLSDMAIAKKNYAEAKRHLIQAMALTQNQIPVALKLAEIYMETADYKKAESLYRKLLEDDPKNPKIYENIGKIMLKKKSYKEAVQAYVRAVELDEKDDHKFISLGKIYHLMMRYSVAAECFKRAAELKPREVEYLFLLAESCIADEDYDNALFTYERILTIEPYNERAKSLSQDVRLKLKEQEAIFSQ